MSMLNRLCVFFLFFASPLFGDYISLGKFSLSRTELRNAEYCEFLNAVAREGDPFCLWNPLMTDSIWGGIVRTRCQQGLRYFPKDGYADKPVTPLSWISAARYCNWLSYGKPNVGVSVLGTTEGNDCYGVYDTRQFEQIEFIRSCSPIPRRTSEAYYIPTLEEWRQACPDANESGLVNIYSGHWALPWPHLSDVDKGCTNQLGFINAHGNVAEWVETRKGTFLMALGGSLIRGEYSLSHDYSEGDEANKPIGTFGVRIAASNCPKVLPRPSKLTSPVCQLTDVISPKKWVRVGDEGNPRDSIYKVGRVDYTYEIARCVVTCADWCAFMNDVGFDRAIDLGLYNPDMTTGVCGGIVITAQDTGRCLFSPRADWGMRPVVYVSYRDAMRYCNWLQTGNTEEGAYDVTRPNSRRLPGAKYFLPTDDEWCKAAYYDPTRLGSRKYWDYPCRTSNLPPNDPNLDHSCNYLRDGVHLGEKGPFYLSRVDAYPMSATYYGCLQMAGNVWEWVEPVGKHRLNLRGSSYGYTEFGMGIWNRDEAGFDDELNAFGFRVARAVDNPCVVRQPMLQSLCDRLSDLSQKRLLLLIFASWLVSGLSVLVLVAGLLAFFKCAR